MKVKTKFYGILKKARKDDVYLVLVINKIMPLINKYSLDKNRRMDEDLRSELIEYAISLVKSEDFADKLSILKNFSKNDTFRISRSPLILRTKKSRRTLKSE